MCGLSGEVIPVSRLKCSSERRSSLEELRRKGYFHLALPDQHKSLVLYLPTQLRQQAPDCRVIRVAGRQPAADHFPHFRLHSTSSLGDACNQMIIRNQWEREHLWQQNRNFNTIHFFDLSRVRWREHISFSDIVYHKNRLGSRLRILYISSSFQRHYR